MNRRSKIFWITWLAGIAAAAIILSVFFTGCSPKTIPQQYPQAQNECDSMIKALIDSIVAEGDISLQSADFADAVTQQEPYQLIDTVLYFIDMVKEIRQEDTSCSYYKVQALTFAARCNELTKEVAYYKRMAEQPRARKIVNNINVNSKNKDTQIGDGNVHQEKTKGPATSGNANVIPVKPKAPVIQGDGNTVPTINNKTNVWPWILLGAAVMFILQNVAWRYVKSFNPLSYLSKLKNLLP